MFHFGLPGKCLYKSPGNTPFWRRTFSWKSKMKHEVEYDVCLDILLMGSICNKILIVKKWTSNSKWDIWTWAYFGPRPIGTREPGDPDPGTRGPGSSNTIGLTFDFLHYMALGSLWEGAKYSHGVWDQLADIF